MITSEVRPFVFANANQPVRALTIDGDPWFVARDVCDILQLDNLGEALRNLDEDELTSESLMSGGQHREMKLISESGLYTLIIRSNKPQAKPFRKWVTAEVLPAIRKTGGYAMPGGTHKRADIFHHRRPQTATGLDIRFTCDLTKVISKRSPEDLAVLERLTGIGLSDLAALESHETPQWQELIDQFAAAHIIADDAYTITFKTIYAALLAWYNTIVADHRFQPSAKALSRWLDDHGYIRRKPSGVATVYGLRLVEVL